MLDLPCIDQESMGSYNYPAGMATPFPMTLIQDRYHLSWIDQELDNIRWLTHLNMLDD